MNCHDFERLWNELLDSPQGREPAVVEALQAHAEACPACQALGVAYGRLRQAIATLGSPPAPPAGLSERLLAAHRAQRNGAAPGVFRLQRAGWLTVAAAVLVAGLLALRGGLVGRRSPARSGQPRALNLALVEATSATLALARNTSMSAARLGGEVLDAATVPPLPLPDPVVPSAEALQHLGDRIVSGVQPLSGSARHAFGFLLESALGTREKPAATPAPKPSSGA
jgi:hypothetical protein